MRATRPLVAIALAASLAIALTVRIGAHDRITTSVTWAREIAPIVQARCSRCHVDGGPAPMSLVTYEDARPWARAIRAQVLSRKMPKWSAARGYGDFANDPSLSPFEIQLIAAWADGGAPKALPENPARALPPAPMLTKPAPFVAPAAPVAAEMECGDNRAPTARLLGVQPHLDKGGSVRVIAQLANGDREILGWFRDFDPAFAQTYWLRSPLVLPAGSRIVTESAATRSCRLSLWIN